MKITEDVLSEVSKCSVTKIQFINLSFSNIARIQNFDACVNLRVLILKGNQLDCLYGLERCRQLWKLDVSHNRIKSLDGLSRFVALGSLNLSNNEFNWIELEKIRHLHIIDLIIFDNKKLDKEQHYRNHLIDCLPNSWMIDGLLATSTERAQVEYFFENSALTSKPVRKKLPKEQFIPTDLKTRDIYGDWTTKLFSRFPKNNIQNVEMDKRRLEFICEMYQELINIENKTENINELNNHQHNNNISNKMKLKHILEYRLLNSETCNMILVLLVASLEFSIPNTFMEQTLEYLNLSKIGTVDKIDTLNLFVLSTTSKMYIASLLLSLAKVDRDQNLDANFYDHLFQSLHSILDHVLRLSNSPVINKENNSALLKDHKSLLCTEVTQLFCMIPSFYNHLKTSEELMGILELCIRDSDLFNTIQNMLIDCDRKNKTCEQIQQEIGPFITNLLKINTRNLLNKKTKRNKNLSLLSLSTKTNGKTSRTSGGSSSLNDFDLHLKEKSKSSLNFQDKNPTIGDSVLIGPQCIGRIVTIPETDICLVQFDYLLGINGSMSVYGQPGDHYLYANLKHFEWDEAKKFWRPIGSYGDKITFQYNEDVFEKKIVWPMNINNNMKYLDEIKTEPFYTNNHSLIGQDPNEASLEAHFEKSQENFAVKQRTAAGKNNNEKNASTVQKLTKLELDVNIKNGFTPRMSPSLNTNRTASGLRRYLSEKENSVDLDALDKSDFMNKWQATPTKFSNKLLNLMNDDSPRKMNNTPPSIVSPTNNNSAGSQSVNSLYLQNKLNSKKTRPKSGFLPESSQLPTDRSDADSEFKTADPDYQLIDGNSPIIDIISIDESKKKQQKYQTQNQIYSRPSSPSVSNATTIFANIRTSDRLLSANKRNIRVQDCSNWMNDVQLTSNHSQTKSYSEQINRMKLLMSLKSCRVSTKPKIPILTSPSSQAHESYRGLRPGSVVGDIYLNSRKFIIKS